MDIIVTNEGAKRGEFEYRLVVTGVHRVRDDRDTRALDSFGNQTVHAVCGIGYPDRFFGLIRRAGINVIPHAFSDHYPFRAEDLRFDDELPVLMTEKDAVKCRRFARGKHWYISVRA